ncbi:MUN domain-containing protein [Anatilimnocola floriformis]|uniref:MUN domain-containing protein n=1 Tax=Anatilimnocola floriformis TaxID=2948575 RepID=UPI0020C2517B|nr:MUN domain-containing protein [Anatilimnocola floriformis]
MVDSFRQQMRICEHGSNILLRRSAAGVGQFLVGNQAGRRDASRAIGFASAIRCPVELVRQVGSLFSTGGVKGTSTFESIP